MPKDKNDPLGYVDPKYKFMEEDGYVNNVYTELHDKPSKFPWANWQGLRGSSYHRTKWVPADKRRDDDKSRRRLERDPNHAQWEPRYGTLRWWRLSVRLLGSDTEGRQYVMIRQGQGEPIYLRFGRTITIVRAGKQVEFEEE